ncbi:type VI secretion IcmF C-terminal domain-containing protein [Paraburkholderia bannensis]|uniref:type VI secretion IcmF C-terminal domain-containing protein n=1 Tax=Paraburkholderia bannensis TaxID=765414 RepID=UPI002AC31804|nr:type VI secretion IcmF C-terminal domain-containing protein [Paraburkholderia bannensis]
MRIPEVNVDIVAPVAAARVLPFRTVERIWKRRLRILRNRLRATHTGKQQHQQLRDTTKPGSLPECHSTRTLNHPSSPAIQSSLPELARFLKPQGGVLDTFLTTQLAGALQLQGDQWVPASGGAGAGSTSRAFDPAFLKAINTLHKIAAHLLAQGEPQYVFSLKPVPVPGLTDTLLTLDGQSLHYYNQVETWSTMTWPSGEPQKAGTRLEWQTESAGTSRSFEFSGRWALVRMLERATVEPLDSATYQLTWRASAESAGTRAAVAKADATMDTAGLNVQGPLAPAPAEFTHPVHYIMRTDVGRGPLELLALRGFELPSRIFFDRAVPTVKAASPMSGPPPLPKAAIAAAKQAAVSLPAGGAP